MVRKRLVNDGLVENQIRFGEARLDVPDLPSLRPLLPPLDHLAVRIHHIVGHRHAAFRRIVEVFLGPLERDEIPPQPRVSFYSRVRAAGPQAVQGVQREGKGLEVDLDQLDRIRRGGLVDRRDREDGLTLVVRVVREALLTSCGLRHLIGREHANHAVQSERCARVDARDAAVRHGTRQQLGEHHTVRPEVLRVPRPSRDLRMKIGRSDILSYQFFSHHRPLMLAAASTRRHAWRKSGSCRSRRTGTGCRRAPERILHEWGSGWPRPSPPCS